jgi:hypothetical protein
MFRKTAEVKWLWTGEQKGLKDFVGVSERDKMDMTSSYPS